VIAETVVQREHRAHTWNETSHTEHDTVVGSVETPSIDANVSLELELLGATCISVAGSSTGPGTSTGSSNNGTAADTVLAAPAVVFDTLAPAPGRLRAWAIPFSAERIAMIETRGWAWDKGGPATDGWARP
jgi:hypothetical protein